MELRATCARIGKGYGPAYDFACETDAAMLRVLLKVTDKGDYD